MGIPNCSHCRKNQDDNQEIIKAETPLTNKPQNLGKSYNSYNNNSYKNFNQMFKSKINELGRFIPNKDFTSLIPEEANNYMIQNAFDINKHLKNNKETYEVEPVEFYNGNIYKGNWNNDIEMDGYGQYILKNDDVFVEGIWDKGLLYYGRIFLPNGEIYEGEIENSLFNGKGKLISNNGDSYEGIFRNGEKSDSGKIIFKDGCVYEGKLINENIPNGKGEFKWANITDSNTNVHYNNSFNFVDCYNYIYTYKGDFINGKIEGFGTLKNEKSGSEYKGNFKNNLFDGKGVFKWGKASIVYDGEYKNGLKNGNGNYLKKNFKYSGNWNEGKPHGLGLVDDGNKIYKCSWRNGFTVETPTLQIQNNTFNDVDINFVPEKEDNDFDLLNHLNYDNLKDANFTPIISYNDINN